MPLVINSNISSINAQRQLVKSGNELSQAMERLSSGKRINTAGDDAAGLAIANRMTSQIKGLDQAVRNANDGISMIQTAEGAMDETTNILQRMRQLSIQAANGIYSDADRGTLDAEVQQLKQEVDRIAATTSFNGQKVLDGSMKEKVLQVGSNANETIALSVGALNTRELGSSGGGDIVGVPMDLAKLVTMAGTAALDIQINNQSIGNMTTIGTGTVSLTDGDPTSGSLKAVLNQINNNVSGVEAKAFVEIEANQPGTGILQGTDVLSIAVVEQDGTSTTYEVTNTSSLKELAEKIESVTGSRINAQIGENGRLQMSSDSAAQITLGPAANTDVQAALGMSAALPSVTQARLSLDSTTDEPVTLTFGTNKVDAADAFGMDERTGSGDIIQPATGAFTQLNAGQLKINNIDIGNFASADLAGAIAAINEKSNETGVVASDNGGRLALNSVGGDEIKIEFAEGVTSTDFGGIKETNESVAANKNLKNISVATAKDAQSAIDVIDSALETINAIRADLGAITNRLDHTISNLMNISENTSASRSRIVDADFAAETANLSRAQVLQQASQAMLAQANAAPQQVLSLLQG